MIQVFEHQIDQIVTYLSWGQEWVGDSEDRAYNTGGAEALGHLLACWICQVGGVDEFETACERDLLFTRTKRDWKPRKPEQVRASLISTLKSLGVEVREG